MNITCDLRGSPTLERFLDSRELVEGVMGPFGSGKSTACVMKMITLAHETPPSADGIRRSRWLVVRNTYPQLRDTTMRTLFEWLPPARWGQHYVSDHRYVVTEFAGVEIEFLFRALDRPDHVQNLLSLEATHAWLNEAREIPREIFGPLRGRLGRYPRLADTGPYEARLIMDTNPPDTDSWWYDLFERRRPPRMVLFKQPGGRSPLAENRRNLPPRYYEDMADSMSEDEQRIYIDAEYGYLRRGQPVYPEYRDSWHCAEFEVGRYPILRAWDFGLTPACVFLQAQPSGQVRVIDEVVSDRAGIQQFAPVVLAHFAQHYPWAKGMVRDVGDPAGEFGSQTDEQSCFDMLRQAGVDCWPGQQDVGVRLEAVRHLLRLAIDGQPGLLVHPRCERVRKGFQGEYHYRRLAVGGGEERYAPKPDKNKYSHPHDALQYGAVEIVGDRVRGWELRPDEAPQAFAQSNFDPFDYLDGGTHDGKPAARAFTIPWR